MVWNREWEAVWCDPLSYKGLEADALYVVLTALTVSREVTVKVPKVSWTIRPLCLEVAPNSRVKGGCDEPLQG